LPEPEPSPAPRDPVWSGWDVLQIAGLSIVAIIVFAFVLVVAAQKLFYPTLSFTQVGTYPLISVVAQGLAYLLVFAFMDTLVKRQTAQPFWQAVHWNWPTNWMPFLLGGVVLSVALQGVAHLLPIPKELPMDRFFQTPGEAWALSLFGVTFAPLFEEMFFRGFLYPVLVRRLGVTAAVVLTAMGFGLIHAPQLAHAWGPVLLIFLVGLALTITRAMTNSVAPGFLMHVAYNGTISVLIFAGTSGFRHLERMNQ